MVDLGTIVTFPVSGPVRGFVWILRKIKEQVDTEMLDESLVEQDLVRLSLRHDLGEITEDEYLVQETALLDRLSAIRAYKESLERPISETEESEAEEED